MRVPYPMLTPAAVILFTPVVGIGHSDDYEEAYRLREGREILPLGQTRRQPPSGEDPEGRADSS